MLHELIKTYFNWVHDWGYGGVIVLMAMESSIFPVPSEVVMPPAAYWAAQGKLNFWGVVASGTFGSWLGSAITYWVARYAGRPIVEKYGKYFLMPPEKVERAERMIARYQKGGLFFSRLLPVVRHLISIPAGLIQMPFGTFSLITTIGAGIWCYILSWYGRRIALNNPGLIDDPEKMMAAVKHDSLWIVGGIAGLAAAYFLMKKLTSEKKAESAQS